MLIYFVKQKTKTQKERFDVLVMLLLFFIFMLVSSNYSSFYFNLDANVILFSIFYIIGYMSMIHKFKNFKTFIITEISVIIIFILCLYFNKLGIKDMQNLKFSVNYIYFIASLISTFLIIYLKDNLKVDKKFFSPIVFIGKNALYLYFSQGLSSTLLILLVEKIKISNIMLKLLVMFLINLTLAIIFFIILITVYKIVDIVLKKLKLI